jgi:hypothetical protein
MDEIAADIAAQLKSDFSPEEFPQRLIQLAAASSNARIQRCIVFAARGHAWYFDFLCKLAKIDFRDVIMAAEYDRLGAQLYDFNRPIGKATIDDPYGKPTP